MKVCVYDHNSGTLEVELKYTKPLPSICRSSFHNGYQLNFESFLANYTVTSVLMLLRAIFPAQEIKYVNQHTDDFSSLQSVRPPFNVIHLDFGRDAGKAKKIRILRKPTKVSDRFFISFEHPKINPEMKVYELNSQNYEEVSRFICEYSSW